MNLLVNVVKSGLVPASTDYNAMASNFTAGKAAMAITGPWEFPNFQKALGGNLGVANIPTLPGGVKARPYIGVRGWEVNAYSQNQALAWQLAKYITFNGQAMIGNAEGRLPVLKTVPGLRLTKLQEGAAKQFQDGVPIPNIPEMGQVWTPIGNAITLAAQGRASSKAALASAVKQIQAGIAKMHQ
jgi:arabinogalactan oligomer/maltooligosaccharide transport system substrate-binding protein